MLCGPILLKFLIYASLDSFIPRLAVTHSACLHGSRCVRVGGRSFHNRSLSNRSLCDRSLHDRSCRSSSVRLTGTSSRGVRFLLRLLAGLTRCHLGPPRQRDPHQVGTLMEVALLSHQSMVITPLLYPSCKISEPIEVEARGLQKCSSMYGMYSIGHLSLIPNASSLCGRKWEKNLSLSRTHSASLKEAVLYL